MSTEKEQAAVSPESLEKEHEQGAAAEETIDERPEWEPDDQPEETELSGFDLLRDYVQAMDEKGEYVLWATPGKYSNQYGPWVVVLCIVIGILALSRKSYFTGGVMLLIGLALFVLMLKGAASPPSKRVFLRFTKDGFECPRDKKKFQWKDIALAEPRFPVRGFPYVRLELKSRENPSRWERLTGICEENIILYPSDGCNCACAWKMIQRGVQRFAGCSDEKDNDAHSLLDPLLQAREYIDLRVLDADCRILFTDGTVHVLVQGEVEQDFSSVGEMMKNCRIGKRKLAKLADEGQVTVLGSR